MENTIKITKAMRFEDVKAVLTGESAKYSSIDELVAFIDRELEMLRAKNARKSTKPTKEQEIMAGLLPLVQELVYNHPEGITAGDVFKGIDGCSSTSKATSALHKLIDAGLVRSEKIKGRVNFFPVDET